jgi:uncharacterized protein YPO0396
MRATAFCFSPAQFVAADPHPAAKSHIEIRVACVGFVHNEAGRESRLRSLSIEEYRAQKASATGGVA